MAMQRPWFDALVDDDGSGLSGTVWQKARIAEMTDALDGSICGSAYFQTAAQTKAAGWAIVPLTGVEFGAAYATAIGTFTIPAGKGGAYVVAATVLYGAAAAGDLRGVMIQRNGAIVVQTHGQSFTVLGSGPSVSAVTVAVFDAGDVITLLGFSTAATTIEIGSRFALARV